MNDDSIGNENTIKNDGGDNRHESLSPGTTLGDYKIIEELGRGGMGVVYLAEHTYLRKKYALKVLPEKLSSDDGFVSRFFDDPGFSMKQG